MADGVCSSDQVEVKRRRRGMLYLKRVQDHLQAKILVADILVSVVSDVVISFVKKTVAGVAGLLRLRNPLRTRCEKPGHYEESQVGILVSFTVNKCQSWCQTFTV